ncbi:DUF6767 domain-containing protein [Corynebacterium parakroppenstedtii]|uniref:DUF6767 domain-containing protein n=1 Tax=Corynebacterium parakroppenstedtii TaxID=2828363 RepID=UPI0036F30115
MPRPHADLRSATLSSGAARDDQRKRPRPKRNPRRRKKSHPDARCPIRFGEPCTACQPGTSGPADCQLVQMVRMDPELMERMRQMNLAHRHTS